MSFWKQYSKIPAAASTGDLGLNELKVTHEYPQATDSEDLLSDSERDDNNPRRKGEEFQNRGLSDFIIRCALLFFVLTTLLLLGAYTTKKPTDNQCARQNSIWSPLHDVVEYEEHSFDNAVGYRNKYMGIPTPELDESWKDLWYFGGIPIPTTQLPKLNRTIHSETYSMTKDKKNVHGLIEVFHEIHCLNILRQHTWKEYYVEHNDTLEHTVINDPNPVIVRMHLDHCIEQIRIALMCHGDVTPFLVIEDKEAPLGGRADFGALHKCVNYDKLVDYMKANQFKDGE